MLLRDAHAGHLLGVAFVIQQRDLGPYLILGSFDVNGHQNAELCEDEQLAHLLDHLKVLDDIVLSCETVFHELILGPGLFDLYKLIIMTAYLLRWLLC